MYTTRQGRKVAWRVRFSSRAKHVRLVLSGGDGLGIVAPNRWCDDPESLLIDHDAWIDRMVARLERVAAESGQRVDTEHRLPATIALRAVHEMWHVTYTPSPSSRIAVHADRTSHVLGIFGPVGEKERVARALRRFVARRAEGALPLRMRDIAASKDLPLRSVRVYPARSRWGSCSTQGDIMLSTRLLFLSPELAEHVMMHELAHLSHMDHGSRFHARLDAFDPLAREHARGLREAGPLVPWWMDVRRDGS